MSTSEGRPIHALQRVMGAITIKAVKQRDVQITRNEQAKLREELFEFQVAIAGNANEEVAWQPADCRFPAPMIPAPLQRDSDLEVPQFFFGYNLYASSAPVVVVAYVDQWLQDENDYTTGANVQIGAYTPGRSDSLDFAGFAHLTFQGFSGPLLEEDDTGAA